MKHDRTIAFTASVMVTALSSAILLFDFDKPKLHEEPSKGPGPDGATNLTKLDENVYDVGYSRSITWNPSRHGPYRIHLMNAATVSWGTNTFILPANTTVDIRF